MNALPPAVARMLPCAEVSVVAAKAPDVVRVTSVDADIVEPIVSEAPDAEMEPSRDVTLPFVASLSAPEALRSIAPGPLTDATSNVPPVDISVIVPPPD